MSDNQGSFSSLDPGNRILMGPGPSDMHPRVYQAMGAPLTGHLDPYFIKVMDETKTLLRYVFQTENKLTFPISATGSAGMETCICNLVEPGDEVLICISGVFGERMAEMVKRHGGQLNRLVSEPGQPISGKQLREALESCQPKLVGLVHAETSTGVLQPLEEIIEVIHEYNALVLVDTVASLGGTPVKVDDWNIDVCYTGSQKCLSAPPGLSPVTFNERAVEMIAHRKVPVDSWYLDLTLINSYWNEDRIYHHTAPINLIYALREALILIHEEGIDEVQVRHNINYQAFAAGIDAMGLKFFVNEPHRAPTINPIIAPEGVEEASVRQALLENYGIELGGGLGLLKGKAWRIGLMGQSSKRDHVILCLTALEETLRLQGYDKINSGIAAASDVYQANI